MSIEPGDAVAGDAIAVIGLSCRFPGAPDPDAFWRLLRDGGDAVREVPPERSELGVGVRAGFLDRVDEFDPEFFGISPREAAVMDPQQRLMLELSWEALEDAGILPGTLDGSRTGVFAGAIWDDYAKLAYSHGPEAVTHTSITGLSRGLIANRVSYALGLQGPSLVVDSAQSSSLVAVHMAAESLRSAESTLALAGGVSLMVIGDGFVVGDKFGALSPDGRAYTFDDRANGYVRGEGGAVVVLKLLRQAIADGDPIHCVIHGGAVNNDGGGDTLTAPRGAAHEDVLRRAYAHARVDPAEVHFVELHGTGTPVGDPIEAAALGAVLGSGRPDGFPLLVGSVKTNIGHLEGAAGIAGLVKAVLCVRERTLVPSLNFRTPNPRIPLEALRLQVNDVLRPLPDGDGPLLAGVSSFGMGGTNCHLVLSSWTPPIAQPAAPVAAPVPVLVSGRTDAALRVQAERLHAHLRSHPDQSIPDVAWSLATSRSQFGQRAVLLADDRGSLVTALADLAGGRPGPGSVRGAVNGGGLAFLFTGQGSQRAGMGRELYETSAVFAEALDAVCAQFDARLDRPLRDLMFTQPDPLLLDQTV